MTVEYSTIVRGPGEGKIISQMGVELTWSQSNWFWQGIILSEEPYSDTKQANSIGRGAPSE